MNLIKISPFFSSILLLSACGGGGGDSSQPNGSITTPTPVPATSTPTPSITPSPLTPTPVVTPPPTAQVAEYRLKVADVNVDNPMSCYAGNDGDTPNASQRDTFVEISTQIGIDYTHIIAGDDTVFGQSGGVGAGDFDNDGWVDLYAIGGNVRPNLLLKNQGDGSFQDIARDAGVALTKLGSGPAFGDFNGDGWLDLFVGSVGSASPNLFVNQADGTFEDITGGSGLDLPDNNISATWGDYDGDQDLDLVVAHWKQESSESRKHLWRNNGDLTFTDTTTEANLRWFNGVDWSFSPNFADVNNDGLQDILFVSDGRTSAVFLNSEDGPGNSNLFEDIADNQISDRSGMGSAVGDYDNDGDLDWFVTSISVASINDNIEGNRFYENQGDGFFLDVTDQAGVREGSWGWGACFADFNNDGYIDIFHVNGQIGAREEYDNDLSRLFISNGDGSFTERSVASGIEDDGMGRGVVCFDYDRDGDQDIFIANHGQPPKLYCNYGNESRYLNIRLEGQAPNTQALGARIYVRTGDSQQMRELRAGNNYVSQNPVEAHFGLSSTNVVDEVIVVWPDGAISTIEDVSTNQFIVIERM